MIDQRLAKVDCFLLYHPPRTAILLTSCGVGAEIPMSSDKIKARPRTRKNLALTIHPEWNTIAFKSSYVPKGYYAAALPGSGMYGPGKRLMDGSTPEEAVHYFLSGAGVVQ